MEQISILQTKILHLQETLKLEEQESKIYEKLEIQKQNSIREAELVARKEQERAKEQVQLEVEESATNKIVKKMVTDSEKNLSPITNAISHFEGAYF